MKNLWGLGLHSIGRICIRKRGRGLTVFDIFVNYSAQQYCIRIRSSSYRSGHLIKKASLTGLCSG